MDVPQAALAAENTPCRSQTDLVRSGLALARNERLDDEDGAVEADTGAPVGSRRTGASSKLLTSAERPKSAAVGWLSRAALIPCWSLGPASPRGTSLGSLPAPPSQQHPRSPCDKLPYRRAALKAWRSTWLAAHPVK